MYDIAIIGGGINGCGIARDAAGRGMSVVLAEKGDLASGTSSGSTKLIHGGLRYLEHYEFRLVREALKERELLWNIAPHIVWPMRFVLPHNAGMRPAWLIRLGLFLYDHIGGRKRLPPTEVLNLAIDPAGEPLRSEFRKAFEYSDCWVDDARLVVLNARDAANHDASIRPRTEVIKAHRIADHWKIETRTTEHHPEPGQTETFQARTLVNAAGPWVDNVLGNVIGSNGPKSVRLVQGSHIVIRRRFPHDKAYFFQNADGRILFAIPYQTDFTMIGTTDRENPGDLDTVAISENEITYLCEAASTYLADPVTRDDIASTFAGVRPLYDDGASAAQEATRDYVLKRDGETGQAPLLSVFGGKITTYRKLAEAALEALADDLPSTGASWTGTSPLPGGDFNVDRDRSITTTQSALKSSYPFLSERTARRLLRAYGTDVRNILGDATSMSDLGQNFGADLTEREIEYLRNNEWAVTSEDILWRRTKIGLHITKDEATALDTWLRT